MKRTKPATRRPKAAKKKQVIVGVRVTDPTPKQIAALKKMFSARKLATIGIVSAAGPTTNQARVSRRQR